MPRLELLETRLAPATSINILATGAGSLDSTFAANNGVILVTDGGMGGTQAESLSAAALEAANATTNISIAARTSITFTDQGGTPLALQTGLGHSDTFLVTGATAAAISFSNVGNTLSSNGGTLNFTAGTNLTVANLDAGGGNINLTAGTNGSGNISARALLTQGNGNITLTATNAAAPPSTITQTGLFTGQAINVTATGNVSVDQAKGTTVTLISNTGSVSSLAANPIQASAQLTLTAATGITVNTLAATLQATNSTSGNISVTQSAAATQALTTGGSGVINSAAGGLIFISNLGSTITVAAGAPITSTNNAGATNTITLLATDFTILNTINSGTAITTLGNSQLGTPIDLGTDNVFGKISLTQIELNFVTASVLRVGTNTAGSITVSQPITNPQAPGGSNTLTLVNNSTITESAAGSLGTAAIPIPNLRVSSTGPVTLTNDNNVGVLAASTTNGFSFTQQPSTNLIIGVIDGVPGITTANSNVTLTTDNIDIQQAIQPGTGIVTLTGRTAAQVIDIGTGAADAAGVLGISDTELGLIASGITRIGDPTNTGGIVVGAVTRTPTFPNTTRSQTLDLVTGSTATNPLVASATGAITQTATLSVANLATQTVGGVQLTNAGNNIDQVAGSVTGGAGVLDNYRLVDAPAGALTVGTVAGIAGITVAGSEFLEITTTGALTFTNGITGDQVGLNAGGAVTQGNGAVAAINTTSVGGLHDIELIGMGPYTLTNPNNSTNRIAANVANSVSYTNAGALTILAFNYVDGFGGPVTGITTTNAPISVNTVNGALTVSNPVNAGTSTVSLTAGSNFNNRLLSIQAAVTGNGGVTLTGDNMTVNAAVNAGPKTALLQPFSPGQNINLGGADAPGTLGLTSAEINNVTAGVIQVGNNMAGDLTITAQINPTGTNQLELITNNHIINGAAAPNLTVTRLGLTAGAGIGFDGGIVTPITTAVSNLEATTLSGGIAVTNTGALTIGGVNGTLIGLNVIGSGDVNVVANATITLSDSDGPQMVHGGNSSGNVFLTANGATSDITEGTAKQAVIVPKGSVTLTAGHDVLIGAAGTIVSGNNVDADVNVILNAGRDIIINNFSFVSADSNDTISSFPNYPASDNTGGSVAATAGRNITVGDGASPAAVFAAGNAHGSITFTAGANSLFTDNSPITPNLAIGANIGSFSGNVTINADRVALTAGPVKAPLGIVTIQQVSAAWNIDLGSTVDTTASTLELSSAELGLVTAPTLRIGDPANTGNIVVSAAVSAPNVTALSLRTSGSISDNAPADTITVNSLAAKAGTGISLDTVLSNVAFSNSSGAVRITNTGGMTVTSVDTLTPSANNGAGSTTTTLTANAGELVFAVNVTSNGTLSATSTENTASNPDPVSPDEPLIVNAGVTVRSVTGNLILTTGDSLTLTAGSTEKADAGSVTLQAGIGDDDNDASITLDGNIVAANGITILAPGDIVLTTPISAPGQTVKITSTNGAILDGNDIPSGTPVINITAGSLALSAFTGIGRTNASSPAINATDAPLETQVDHLEARTATGGIFINNGFTAPTTLNIDNVNGLGGVRVTGASGDIVLKNNGTIDIITFNEIVKGPGNITVTANGASADVVTGGGNNFDAIISTGGTTTITAGHDILIGNPGGGPGNRIGDVQGGGSVVLSAGRNIVVDVDSFVDAHGTGTVTALAGGNISILHSGAPALTNARISTEGGAITLTTGPNGLLTVDSESGAITISTTQNGGNGNIFINADRINLTSNDGINAGTAAVTIQQVSPTWAINLGSATDAAASTLELSDVELGEIIAGTALRIGSPANTGAITVTAPITTHAGYSTLHLRSAGSISETGTGSLSVTNLSVQGGGGVSLNAAGNAVSNLSGDTSSSTGFFSTGNPDGRMATGSRTDSPSGIEIEAADDFLLNATTQISGATFTGLLPTGSSLSNASQVVVEIYRVFPLDSAPFNNGVPTRTNSPSDNAFDTRDSRVGGLTFTASVLAGSFTANNSVLNGIHTIAPFATGGEGAVTGEEVQFQVNFTTPFNLPAGHYFFVPQVLDASGNFLWLSAPKPIVAPGTPFVGDLQEWIRNANLDPNWLRVGTDIVGGAVPPQFNATFSLATPTLTPGAAFSFNDSVNLDVNTVDTLNGVTTNGGTVNITDAATLTIDVTPSFVKSNGGAISLTAAKFVNTGTPAAGTVDSTNGANPAGVITIAADNMDLQAGSTINSGTARTILETMTAGTPINLGGADTAAPVLGLTNAEINTVTAGVIQVGSQTAGAMSITAAITPTGTQTIDLESGSTITETSASGTVTIANLAIRSVGSVTMGSANDVTANLAARVTGAGNSFVFIDSDATHPLVIGTADTLNGITTNGGVISVTATAPALTVNQPVSSGAANITLTAVGIDSFINNNSAISNTGGNKITLQANEMALNPGSSITAAGAGARIILEASTAGRLVNLGSTIDPNGSLNLSNAELNTVFISNATGVLQIGNGIEGNVTVGAQTVINLQSATLNLTINTAGAILGSGSILVNALRLSAGSNGVNLPGNNNINLLAGADSVGAQAFLFNNFNAGGLFIDTVDGVSGITTTNGAITVTAFTGITANQNVSAGTAPVVLTVDNANGLFTNNAAITGGSATLTADRMALGSTPTDTISVGSGPANIVILQPFTLGQPVNIDNTAGDPLNELRLSQTELNTITAGVLRIGSTAAGNLTIKSPVVAPGPAALSLISGGTITQSVTTNIITATNLALQAAGGVNVQGNNVVVQLAGSSTGGVFIFTDNHDLAVGTVDSVVGITGSGADVTLLVENPNLIVTDPGLLTVTNAITNLGGNIKLTADNMALNAPLNAGTGSVFLQRFDGVITAINLGGADSAVTLGLTNAELSEANAALLQIGSTGIATPIVVSTNISGTPYTTLALQTTGSLTEIGGSRVSGTNLSLNVGSLGGTLVSPFLIGESSIAATVASGSVFLSNNTASGLTVSGTALDGVTGLTATAAGATVNVTTTAGPLTIAGNILANSTITLQTTETVGDVSEENLTVNSGVTVESTTGNVVLTAADSMNLQSTSLIKSDAGSISLTFGNGDTDSDATLTLNGALSAATGISITGPGDIILTSNFATGGTLSITSTNGSIRDDGDDSTFISAPNISLTAAKAIGGDTPIALNDVLTQDATFRQAIDFKLLGGTLSISQTGAGGNIQLRDVNGTFNSAVFAGSAYPTPVGSGKQLALIASGGAIGGTSFGDLLVNAALTLVGAANVNLLLAATNGNNVNVTSAVADNGTTGPVTLVSAGGNVTVGAAVSAGSPIILAATGTNSFINNNAAISNTGGNLIMLEANEMALNPGSSITASGGGRVILEASAAGRLVNLGAVGDPNGSLNLSNAELNTITTTGVLQVGSGIEGNVTITNAIAVTAPTLDLSTAGSVGETGSGAITVTNLAVAANGADLSTNASAVSNVAASTPSVGFALLDSIPLTVTTVDGTVGIGSSSVRLLSSVANSLLTVSQAVTSNLTGIDFKFDNMALNAAVTATAPAQTVLLEPFTAGQLIDVGGADALGTLGLTNTELSRITSSILRIGSTTAGDLNISAAVSGIGHFATLTLISNGVIAQTGAGAVTVTNLDLQGAGNVVLVTNPNTVSGSLAGSTSNQAFLFVNSGTITIGTADMDSGINIGTGVGGLRANSGAIRNGLASGNDVTAGALGLNAGGGLGTAAKPLMLAVGMLNTKSGNAPEFLSAASTTTLRGTGLNAGTGGIVLTGGTFVLSANNQIEADSPLRLAGATLNLGAFSNTIAALSISSSSTLGILLNAFSAGNFGNLTVNGYLSLGNATLNLTLKPGFSAPAHGSVITLIRNVSNFGILGTFAGQPEGSTITVGGFSFRISYLGGAGHDVTLTAM